MNRYRTALLALGGAALLAGTAALWQARAAETIPTSEVSHIHGIAVDRSDPSRLYLATHHGVFRTNADGTATRVSEDRSDYMGFTPNPEDPAAFFASGHPAGGGNLGVLSSRDAGRSWQQLSEGAGGPVDFHAMDVSAADPRVMYGLYGGVQVSRDAGRTWTVTGRPPADTFDLAASAKDRDTVYAATRDGLMVSRDAGKSWNAAYPVQRPATLVAATPAGVVYAFQVGTGLLKTTEPSLAWEPVGKDWGERVVLHLAVDPDDPERLYAVTDESRILTSRDGGLTWAPLVP